MQYITVFAANIYSPQKTLFLNFCLEHLWIQPVGTLLNLASDIVQQHFLIHDPVFFDLEIILESALFRILSHGLSDALLHSLVGVFGKKLLWKHDTFGTTAYLRHTYTIFLEWQILILNNLKFIYVWNNFITFVVVLTISKFMCVLSTVNLIQLKHYLSYGNRLSSWKKVEKKHFTCTHVLS